MFIALLFNRHKGVTLMSNICVAITNYGFSDNADLLKKEFSAHLSTILIDSSSPNPPISADLKIDNTYYPGLWNAAVKYANENNFEWLMFVASDLRIPNVNLLCAKAVEATKDDSIGVYSPSLEIGSRLSFKDCFNGATNALREVWAVEGFFFLARLFILKNIYPISIENKYGYLVDTATCYMAHDMGYKVVVDDSVTIFHPVRLAEHSIDVLKAWEMGSEYYKKVKQKGAI